MPKFPKSFGRRKVSAPQLDHADIGVVEPSFKVFERPDTTDKSVDGSGVKLPRNAAASTNRANILSLEDDNMFVNVGYNRGSSGTSNTLTSTTDDSSRLSAASTTPSSTDNSHGQEWKSPLEKPFYDIPRPPVLRSSSAFSLKHAGRAMSWGKMKPPSMNKESMISPTVRSEEDETAGPRSRAVTGSSSASTTVPPKLEHDLSLNLEEDFSDIFAGYDKQKSAVTSVVNHPSPSAETSYSSSATQSHISRPAQPSPLDIDQNTKVEPSPYSWSSSQHSSHGLIGNTSPPLATPRHTPESPTTLQHPPRNMISPTPHHKSSPRALGASSSSLENGVKRSSGIIRRAAQRQSQDQDLRLLRESVSASRRINNDGESSPKVDRDSWALPSTSPMVYKVDEVTLASWTTPPTDKAKKVDSKVDDSQIRDTSIAASANLALQFQEMPASPAGRSTEGPHTKVMTPAQFEKYRQDQERLRSLGAKAQDDGEEEEEEETYEDDGEDEAEKAKALAKQRRKQEAHMSVYRQQMMKVTGEAPGSYPSAPSRPSVFATQSSPNLSSLGRFEGPEEEDEDDEVPLAILQAHGFPSKNKTPMRTKGSNPNMKSAGASNGGNLPVFARNLPQDPYYGAGIVNPMHRESMAFAGGAASANGVSRGLPPGGLVGVIATEERSRAMRRGSPKPQGEYSPQASYNMGGGGGVNLRSSIAGGNSVYNGMAPGMFLPPPPPPPSMGPFNPTSVQGDQAQMQMSQMQQFMQMQMQFMQMMTNAGSPQPLPQRTSQVLPPTLPPIVPSTHELLPRPSSAQLHSRSLTMLEPNVVPWSNQASTYTPSMHGGNGYAPSIAPSERSTIGLPGRYRPVSQASGVKDKTRASTLSGSLSLKGWETKKLTKTVTPGASTATASPEGDDEDDEGAWEAMAQKKKERKSGWRTKKNQDSNGLKEMLSYAV